MKQIRCDRNIGLFRLAVLALILLFHYDSAAQVDFDAVLEGVKLADSLVKSGIGHLEFQQRYTDYGRTLWKRMIGPTPDGYIVAPDYTENIFFAFEGEKTRLDRETVVSVPDRPKRIHSFKRAFDGEKGTGLAHSGGPSKWTGSIDSKGLLLRNKDPRWWGMTLFGARLSDLLEGKPTGGHGAPAAADSIKLIGVEDIDGELCYVVGFRSGSTRYKIWINPTKNYRLARIEKVGPRIEKVGPRIEKVGHDGFSSVVFTFREYPQGIWFIKTGVSKRYEMNEETGNLELVYENILTVQDDFEINVDVPDELFTIDFPQGTPVLDIRTNRIFTAE